MKLTTTKLIGLLVVLVAIYFGVDLLGGKKKSSSLRNVLVQIDTAAVTKLIIAAPANDLELRKVDEKWQLTTEGGEVVPVDASAVLQSLNALNDIKPARMATRKKEKWSDYQVDSTGTKVAVYAGDQVVTDIVLGKFGMTGQRSYHTHVRLSEDEEVYVAENFMAFSIPSETAAYRMKNIVSFKKDSLMSIQFSYPSDSSFLLEKLDNQWTANSLPTDSTKVAKFLNGLRAITSRNFVETKPESSPIYSVAYTTKNGGVVQVDGYLEGDGLIFNSSANPTSYFADSTILKKAFIGLNDLQ